MRGQEEQRTRAKVFYRIPTLPGPAEPSAGLEQFQGSRTSSLSPRPALTVRDAEPPVLTRKQTAPASYRELSEGPCLLRGLGAGGRVEHM